MIPNSLAVIIAEHHRATPGIMRSMEDPIVRDSELRMDMVASLARSGVVVTDSVEHVLREVPRHRFITEADAEAAYTDNALVVKRAADGTAISSASQPTVVATMLEQLQLNRAQHVLEIGTGTGYNAALLSKLVGSEGHV